MLPAVPGSSPFRLTAEKDSFELCVDTISNPCKTALVPTRNNVPASPAQLGKEYKLMNTIPTTTVVATFTASLKSHYYGWKEVFSASADSKSEFQEKFDKFAREHASSLGNGSMVMDADQVREEIQHILENDGDIHRAKVMIIALADSPDGWYANIADGRFDDEFKVFESEEAADAAVNDALIEAAYRDLYEAEGNHQGKTRRLEVDAWVTVRLGSHEFRAEFKEECGDAPSYEADDIDCEDATDEERQAMADALNEAIIAIEE